MYREYNRIKNAKKHRLQVWFVPFGTFSWSFYRSQKDRPVKVRALNAGKLALMYSMEKQTNGRV